MQGFTRQEAGGNLIRKPSGLLIVSKSPWPLQLSLDYGPVTPNVVGSQLGLA